MPILMASKVASAILFSRLLLILRLQRHRRRTRHQKYLQDAIITIRNDRFVLPVKAEHKNEIGGLVHDVSASGQTLFIEPVQVVAANNELSILAAEEAKEIERILAEFSAEAGDFSEGIIKDFELARFFDFTFAKARYANEIKGVKPVLRTDGRMDLVNARHPLIDKNKVVPISFSLGKDYGALIITGPNTGGKTVYLKLTGLHRGILVNFNTTDIQKSIWNKVNGHLKTYQEE